MGYSGAVYLLQEACNALFDALFHILPLGSDLDKVQATPTGSMAPDGKSLAWSAEAQSLLTEIISTQPVLLQISVAKRLRDRAERMAREAGFDQVELDLLREAYEALYSGVTA